MQSLKLFNKYREGRHWEKHPTRYAEKFAEFLNTNNFKGLIVDIGCGSGRDTDVFSSVGFNAIGIDYATKEIRKAEQTFPKSKFEVQNAEKLKLKNKSAAALFVINVIHYLNATTAFKEFYRVLKEDGYIYIHFNLEIKDEETGKIDYKQSEEKINGLIKKFKIIQRHSFTRTDTIPKLHTHKILELILQKRKTY